MKFNKINDTTVNCIISREELAGSGITLDDIMGRDTKAMEYLRKVIMEAARMENLKMDSGYTSMQIRAMVDGSLSLTISSENPLESGQEMDPLAAAKAAVEAFLASSNTEAESGTDRTDAADSLHSSLGGKESGKSGNHSAEGGKANYIYTFLSMADVIECCRKLPEVAKLKSSLWHDERENIYHLLLTTEKKEEKVEKTLLAMNEFGTFSDAPAEEIGYIMEHCKCILRENAAAKLVRM